MEQLIDFLYVQESSIVMPAYNVEKYISEAIERYTSLFKTRSYYIDDASTSNTVQIIQKYLRINDKIKLFLIKSRINL